ncbi:hypothetical protein [Bartonella sp. B1098]|uniref:hypothetical protein n=1 Tax=Bartonella sp. B1098 TaxID=2911421 RepID=UPI0020C4802F|nr:hypothetical protein [Bartonella sp. B1098]
MSAIVPWNRSSKNEKMKSSSLFDQKQLSLVWADYKKIFYLSFNRYGDTSNSYHCYR